MTSLDCRMCALADSLHIQCMSGEDKPAQTWDWSPVLKENGKAGAD
jgi:hypothetical protein